MPKPTGSGTILWLFAGALGACGQAAPGQRQAAATNTTGSATAPATKPAATAKTAKAADAVKLAEATPLLDFAYSWPAAAAAIPKLDARLRADARTVRQHALNMARDDRKERSADAPFNPHQASKAWAVEGEAAGLLALRNELSSYTGGAHGSYGYEAILWDRAAGRDIAPLALFADRATALRLLTAAFCPALDAERAEKRGEPVVHAKPGDGKAEDWMTDCPPLTEQILTPSGVRGGRFTSFRVLIGPYAAGPYSEGSYEVRLPITPALLALLTPARRAAFAVP